MRNSSLAVAVARALPTAALTAAGVALAWQANGSTAAGDWLPWACGIGLVAVVALAAPQRLPPRGGAVAVGALAGLAAWTFASHWWSAAPSLARDEALLTALYAMALLVPLLGLREPLDRLVATGVVGLVVSLFAGAVALLLVVGPDPAGRFIEGRLAYPISYINAQAAAFVLGWWPCAALAAHRRLPPWLRAAALGGTALTGAAALLCQSKGAELGLVLSAIVVLGVSPGRLRLLVPTAIAAAIDAAAIVPLTAPYRAAVAELGTSVRHAGLAALAAGAAGAVAGLAYALADRRLVPGEAANRRAGRVVGALTALAAAAAVGAFLLVPAHPVGYLQDRWESFKTPPTTDAGGSHLLSLGSYRYDTWRVALHEWRRHPVAGIGSRGFGPAYLVERHIQRTPQHAHSIELETLSDLGLVGFVLLAAGIGIPLAIAVGAARRRVLPAVAALGAASAWLLQGSADWLWSFPAIGVPFFVLLGIGASSLDTRGRLPRPAGLAGVALTLAVVIVGFVPVWIGARLVADAQRHPEHSRGDLRWARRLDPLSTQVLVTRASLASTYDEQLTALRRAVRMEPRQAPLHYLLGVVELNGGRRAAARRELSRALALDPGDPIVLAALASAKP